MSDDVGPVGQEDEDRARLLPTPATQPAEPQPMRVAPRGDGFDKAAVLYSGASWMRGAVVGLLPVVGPAIDAILSTYGGGLVQERLVYCLQQLDGRVGALENEGKGHRKFFESKEGVDLVLAALVASGRTRHRQKIRLYAAILAGAAMDDRPSGAEPEALLNSLINLAPIEVQMLKVIHESQPQGWEATVEAFPPEARSMLGFHMARLEAAGFIGTTRLNTYGGGTNVTTAMPALTALISLAPTLGEDVFAADGPEARPESVR